jgi:hypothetical protein
MIYDSRPCLMLINYDNYLSFLLSLNGGNFDFFLGEMGKFVSESVE